MASLTAHRGTVLFLWVVAFCSQQDQCESVRIGAPLRPFLSSFGNTGEQFDGDEFDIRNFENFSQYLKAYEAKLKEAREKMENGELGEKDSKEIARMDDVVRLMRNMVAEQEEIERFAMESESHRGTQAAGISTLETVQEDKEGVSMVISKENMVALGARRESSDDDDEGALHASHAATWGTGSSLGRSTTESIASTATDLSNTAATWGTAFSLGRSTAGSTEDERAMVEDADEASDVDDMSTHDGGGSDDEDEVVAINFNGENPLMTVSVDGAGGDEDEVQSAESPWAHYEERHLTEPDPLFVNSLNLFRRSMQANQLAEYDEERTARVNTPRLIGPIDSLSRRVGVPWTNRERFQALHVLTQPSDKNPFASLPDELRTLIIRYFHRFRAIRVRVVLPKQDFQTTEIEPFYIDVFPDVDKLIDLKMRIVEHLPQEARRAYLPQYLLLQFGHRRPIGPDDRSMFFLQHYFLGGGEIRLSLSHLGNALSQLLRERPPHILRLQNDADDDDAEEQVMVLADQHGAGFVSAGDPDDDGEFFDTLSESSSVSEQEQYLNSPLREQAHHGESAEPPMRVVDADMTEPLQLTARQLRALAAERRMRASSQQKK